MPLLSFDVVYHLDLVGGDRHSDRNHPRCCSAGGRADIAAYRTGCVDYYPFGHGGIALMSRG